MCISETWRAVHAHAQPSGTPPTSEGTSWSIVWLPMFDDVEETEMTHEQTSLPPHHDGYLPARELRRFR